MRLKMDGAVVDQLPGGAAGSAVVYTKTVPPLGIIQKMTIRMEGYTNYLTGI